MIDATAREANDAIQAATDGVWCIRDVRNVQVIERFLQAESHLPRWRVYAWFPGDCETIRSFDNKADAIAFAQKLADAIGTKLYAS